MSEQQELLDTILEEFRAVVNRHFPDFINSGYGYAGPQFHINLSDDASSFEKTSYYYSEELKFVHWTSIDNLVSIINNRELRLFNLINSDDEQEFVYSAKSLDVLKVRNLLRARGRKSWFLRCIEGNIIDILP